MKKQYAIGEFASLNRITSRMLRYYDQIGLLKPANILDNGYRIYTSNQILTVSKILMFQDCQFTLAEIIDVLINNKDEREMGERKFLELELRAVKEYNARDKLMKIMNKSFQSLDNHYDIVFIEQSKQRLFCSKSWVKETVLEDAIEELYMNIGTGVKGVLHTILDFDKARYRVAIEKNDAKECDGYEFVDYEAGWYISTFHYGEYYNIAKAYDKLLCYAHEKGYKVQGNFIERYYLDSSNVFSSSEYVTQILVKLIP